MTYIPTQETQQLSNEIQEQQLVVLKKMEIHLSKATDLEVKEEDTNDS